MAKKKTAKQVLELLKKFDTPTITNVIATYPGNKETCLGLYDPWAVNWYTDQSIRCIYPELGRKVGYAVTVVFGMPDPSFNRLSYLDVLKAIDASEKPVILCFKQDMPEHIKNKNGLAGGNMVSAAKSLGAVGIVSDGPSRDIDEIRGMDFQYMLTGVCAGHGTFSVKAVNVPVSICGMDVAPGEIIHMDENGAVKFPREHLEAVYENASTLAKSEEKKQKALSSTNKLDMLIKYWQGQY